MSLSNLFLDAFQELAKTGSFTEAAKHLHITQSALSQRIALLERDIGASLIVRDRAGLRLTPEGTRLLRYVKIRSGLEAELLQDMGRMEARTLRVAGFSSIVRSVLLPAVSRLPENVRPTTVTVHTKEFAELGGLLKSGEADVILTGEPLRDAGLETLYIGDEANVWTTCAKVRSEDFCLDHDERDQSAAKYFTQFPHGAPKPIRRRYLDEAYALMDGVGLGLGWAILPRHLIAGRRDIKIIKPSQVLRVPVYLQYWKSPYPMRLLDELVAQIRRESGRQLLRAGD